MVPNNPTFPEIFIKCNSEVSFNFYVAYLIKEVTKATKMKLLNQERNLISNPLI